MEEYMPLLEKTALFTDIPREEISGLLACFAPAVRRYEKGEIILLSGSAAEEIGIVLAGRVHAEKETAAGGALHFAVMGPGEVFGDVLAGSHAKSPVTLTALEPCTLLLLPAAKVLAPCPLCHNAHTKLLQNLVAAIGDKYFALSRRLALVLLPTLRERVSEYLLSAAAEAGSRAFTLPFGRQAMAGYLGCERSALSRELSRMRADGLIAFSKSAFTLLSLGG